MSHQQTHLRHIDQRDFVKRFNALCAGSHSRWEVWADFIQLAAIAISNAVDLSNREEREKTYLQLTRKYSKKEMQGFAELLAIVAQGMEAKRNRFGGRAGFPSTIAPAEPGPRCWPSPMSACGMA